MLAAGVVGDLDGCLEVEDLQSVADNDVIQMVEAVEAESGHGSGLPFQGIGLCVEFTGHLEQPLLHVVIGKLVGHLQQAQGSRA